MCVASPNATMGGDNFDVVQNLKRKIRKGKLWSNINDSNEIPPT